MDPVRAGIFNGGHFLTEAGEVGGQNTRRDDEGGGIRHNSVIGNHRFLRNHLMKLFFTKWTGMVCPEAGRDKSGSLGS
ncbi:hypothetical protein AOE01nite_14580 [Acetobacter oeni]|uniref:Uncharacterized protein n=1 Tax=Acetobacter oeni TaxID=304077 RepID=A0A511XJW4_9PROT|nr:hypothetical protein AOE01nite_14580 [Acetobacter oeni]